MSKHTDGPWWFDDDYYVLAGEEADIICELWTSDREANGKLIAAAPDMLEALQAVEGEIDGYRGDLIQMVRAAIAKAEGRS
jgi:hypothetical protein